MFEIQCGKKQQDDRVCMGYFWICADNLKTQVCRTLKKSPYEVVYGQPLRTTPFTELPKGKEPCVMEEEVADLMDGKHNVY